MAINFRIPKVTDRELVAALVRTKTAVKDVIDLRVAVTVPRGGGEVVPTGDEPETNAQLKFVLDAGSQILEHAHIKGPGGQNLFQVQRRFDQVSDQVNVLDDGWNALDQTARPRIYVAVLSVLRKELRAPDIEAAFAGQSDTEWNRYRDAQITVTNSLQQTAESLLTKVAEKNAELDHDRSARFEKLETSLRAEIAEERKNLHSEIDSKREAIIAHEKTVSDREATFNTKEARYVARQKQDEQIKQIQEWLKDWSLTKGTHSKRLPIFGAYIAALLVTGGLAVYATTHNYTILTTADDLAKLQWWHWLLLTSKAFFPLAAFATFMIYFVRWSSSWARQHADEEFQNRARLIDIGRSSWLLEAVRDAQERNKELPPELVKELSRNLFTTNLGEVGTEPHAAADILLQGLTSLRVKSPDGSEVEAKRGKGS